MYHSAQPYISHFYGHVSNDFNKPSNLISTHLVTFCIFLNLLSDIKFKRKSEM